MVGDLTSLLSAFVSFMSFPHSFSSCVRVLRLSDLPLTVILNASLHFLLSVSLVHLALPPPSHLPHLPLSLSPSRYSERVSFSVAVALASAVFLECSPRRGSLAFLLLVHCLLAVLPLSPASRRSSTSFSAFLPHALLVGGVLIYLGFTSHLNLETSFETVSRRSGRVGVMVDPVVEGLSYEVALLCFVPGDGSFLFEQCTCSAISSD